MTTHPDDVQRGALAWDALMGNRYGAEAVNELRSEVECILAAVLPAHDKRVRADLLRELIEQPVHPLTREWLLSVLERVEGEWVPG